MCGVILMQTNPAIYNRKCNECLRFMFDEKTGHKIMRRGFPMPRRNGSVPCTRGMCDKGSPDSPKTLTLKNVYAYEHYLQCKATGMFPDDPIVQRNAGAILIAEEHVKRIRHMEASDH